MTFLRLASSYELRFDFPSRRRESFPSGRWIENENLISSTTPHLDLRKRYKNALLNARNCLKFKFIRRPALKAKEQGAKQAGWKVQNCINLNKIISLRFAVTAELKFRPIPFAAVFTMQFAGLNLSARKIVDAERKISAEKMKLNWIPLKELKVFFTSWRVVVELIAAEVTLSLPSLPHLDFSISLC